MREDLQEEIMKMLPKGFIIVHVNKDDSISYFMYNPLEVEQIYAIKDGLDEFAQEDGEF